MLSDTAHSRLIKNEQILRDHNSKTTTHLKKFFHYDKTAMTSPLNFICECSNLDCAEYIALSITQYEALHKRRDRFIVHEGHITPTVEKLIDQRDGYAVVEKFELSA